MHDIIENIKDAVEEAIKRLRFGKVVELVLLSNDDVRPFALDIRTGMMEDQDHDGTPIRVATVEAITFDDEAPIQLGDDEIMAVEVRTRRIINVGKFVGTFE